MTDKIHKADFYTADSKEEKIMELHKKLNEVIDVINAQNEENRDAVATARADGDRVVCRKRGCLHLVRKVNCERTV